MQYEFRGKSLKQAVRRSLAENRDVGLRRKGDAGERKSCRQLERWLDQLASEIGDLTIKIEGLKSH